MKHEDDEQEPVKDDRLEEEEGEAKKPLKKAAVTRVQHKGRKREKDEER